MTQLPAHTVAQLDQAGAALEQVAGIVALVYRKLVAEGVPDPYAIGTAEQLVLEAMAQHLHNER